MVAAGPGAPFGIGTSTAQTVMKAVGDVQMGGTHFIEHAALIGFLDAIIAAPSVEEGLRIRLCKAEPPPRPKSLRVTLPADLRRAMLPQRPNSKSARAAHIGRQAC